MPTTADEPPREPVMPARRALSGGVKVGYGAAELGVSASEFFIKVYLLKLYTDVVGLRPILAGVVLALAVLWDAVTDPLMGEISDRTRSAFGRRRPWIAAGGLLTAVTLVVLFAPPAFDGQLGKALYLLTTYMAVNTALTLLSVPHAALGGELTLDPGERNEVFGWRFLFSNLGLVAGIAVPAAVASRPHPAAASAVVLAALVVASALTAVLATGGLDRGVVAAGRWSLRAFLGSSASVLAARPFRPLLAAYVIGSVGLTLNSSLALFYYEHRLRLAERDVFLWILMPFALVIAISIGGWVLVSRRLGKRITAFIGVLLLGIGTAVVYPIFPAGDLAGPVAWGVVGGLLVGSVFLLDATVADVVDWDEAVRGTHREGLYFGFWRMGAKVARAVGLALTGWLLDAIGFVEGAAEQSEHTARWLAWAFGPGVGALLITAAVVYLWVPLDERVQARVRRILDRRRSARAHRPT